MLSQEELFSGTVFAPNLQTLIYAELQEAYTEFPTVCAFSGSSIGDRNLILLQGKLPVLDRRTNTAYLLPISISIDPRFPSVLPCCQIPRVQGIAIVPSHFVMPDGIVLPERIMRWIPGEVRMIHYLGTLASSFAGLCPVYDVRQFAVNVQALNRAAYDMFVAEMRKCEEKMKAAAKVEKEKKMAEHYAAVVKRMKECPPTVIQAKIEPEVQKGIEQRAKEQGHREALKNITTCFHDGAISADDLVETVRRMSYLHFSKVVCPAMTF